MAKLSLGDWETEELSAVYGIISEVNAPKLCYHLNASLGLRMRRAEEDRAQYGKNGLMYYPLFVEEDEQQQLCWYMAGNKHPYFPADTSPKPDGLFAYDVLSGAPLISSLKVIDYFLWCTGLEATYFDATFNIQLKSVPYVRAIQKLETENHKGLEVLKNN